MYIKAEIPSPDIKHQLTSEGVYNPYSESHTQILDSTMEAEQRAKSISSTTSDSKHKTRMTSYTSIDSLFSLVYILMSINSMWTHAITYSIISIYGIKLLFSLTCLCIVTSNKVFNSTANTTLRSYICLRRLIMILSLSSCVILIVTSMVSHMARDIEKRLDKVQPLVGTYREVVLSYTLCSLIHTVFICSSQRNMRDTIMYWSLYSGYYYL